MEWICRVGLQDKWNQLWQSLQAAPNDNLLGQLFQAYSTPSRFYHTLAHIQDCLTQFDQVKALAAQPAAIELAIWFHDAIYDPKRSDNEQKSAEWASLALDQSGLSPALVQTVSQLILATRHDSQIGDLDGRLLVDIDLSILGQEESRFWQYSQNIRKEYSWVPVSLYRQKRAAVLQGFLERDPIYSVEFFRERFEGQARTNLSGAIANLLSTDSDLHN